MRLNPYKGEYNLYCYCFKKNLLDRHLHNAEKGIRFTDLNGNTLFRIAGGGYIRITYNGNDMLGISKVSFTPGDSAVAPDSLSAPEISLKHYNGAAVYAELGNKVSGSKAFYKKSNSADWISAEFNTAAVLTEPGTYEFKYTSYDGTVESAVTTVKIGNSGNVIYTDEDGIKKAIGLYEATNNITVSSDITVIADNAFKNAGYAEISIPNTVTNIGANAFGTDTTRIYISAGAKIVNEAAFANLAKTTKLYVVKNSSSYNSVKEYSGSTILCVLPELGDSNGDWGIDIRDLVSMKKKAVDTSDITVTESADVDLDGKVKASDLTLLRKTLLTGIPLSYLVNQGNF